MLHTSHCPNIRPCWLQRFQNEGMTFTTLMVNRWLRHVFLRTHVTLTICQPHKQLVTKKMSASPSCGETIHETARSPIEVPCNVTAVASDFRSGFSSLRKRIRVNQDKMTFTCISQEVEGRWIVRAVVSAVMTCRISPHPLNW